MIVCLSASDLMNVYINNVPFKSHDDIKTSFFFFLRQTENVSGPESEKGKQELEEYSVWSAYNDT